MVSIVRMSSSRATIIAGTMPPRVIATTGSPDKADGIAALARPDAVLTSEGRFREQVADITGGTLAAGAVALTSPASAAERTDAARAAEQRAGNADPREARH